MKDMHDAMASWAKPSGERVAQSLEQRGGLAEARARIANGRRRRTVGALASAFAVVGAVAVAVEPGWIATNDSIWPGVPDRWLDEEGRIEWSEDGSVVDAPFVLGPRMALGDGLGDPLRCGATWNYEPGAYMHDTEASEQVERFSASAVFREDGEILDGLPEVMTPEQSELAWQFAYKQGDAGPGVEFQVASVTVADGVVVGRGEIGGGAGGGTVTFGEVAPFPGECYELAQTELGSPYVPTDDGTYDQHLVIQFVHAVTFEPVATFVDPAGSLSLAYADLASLTWPGLSLSDDNGDVSVWQREEDEPSPGRFDDSISGMVSGRVVPATPSGCTPHRSHLISVIADRDATQIPVALADVDVNADDVIASVYVPAGQQPPWFVGEHAWLVVERGSIAKRAPYLKWTEAPSAGGGTTWTLALGGDTRRDPTVVGPDCHMTFEYSPPSGQVWLAIAGRGEVLRTDDQDWETWVYLGEITRPDWI
jgi:hypothetical protein